MVVVVVQATDYYTRGEIALAHFGLLSVWLLLWLDEAASTKGTLRLQSPQLTDVVRAQILFLEHFLHTHDDENKETRLIRPMSCDLAVHLMINDCYIHVLFAPAIAYKLCSRRAVALVASKQMHTHAMLGSHVRICTSPPGMRAIPSETSHMHSVSISSLVAFFASFHDHQSSHAYSITPSHRHAFYDFMNALCHELQFDEISNSTPVLFPFPCQCLPGKH